MSQLQVVYAGDLSTGHAASFYEFLGSFGDVVVIDVAGLARADLSGAGLIVIDAHWQTAIPAGLTLDQLGAPTLLIGNYGAHVGAELHLKIDTNYGCMCLDEEAIVWDDTHPVFDGLASFVESKPVPDNFLGYRHLEPPRSVPAMRIFTDPVGGAGQVITGRGFADSPECEVIAGGFNEKSHEHFAIGRQGRFLFWGFYGTPHQMTPEGRHLFGACINHILGFADDPVREYRTSTSRLILQDLLNYRGWTGEGLPHELGTIVREQALASMFDGPAPDAARGSREERLQWYADHSPYIRNDGHGFHVDPEAAALGVPTNQPGFLDAVLKADDSLLWERYTGRSLDRAAPDWLDTNREHLYFTDWGGYRWVSQLEAANPRHPAAPVVVSEATASLAAARYRDQVQAVMALTVPPGFHAYPPGSQEGLPITMTPAEGVELLGQLDDLAAGTHLTGQVMTRFGAVCPSEELALTLRVQLCDSLTCLAPQTIELRCPIVTAS